MTIPFCQSDAGRSHSRRPKQANDCTVRAYAIAFDEPYDDAYELLASVGRPCSRRFNFKAFAKTHPYLRWHSFPAVKGQTRMNPAKFCVTYPTGRWILKTAKHVLCAIDGVIIDECCPLAGRCIYGAWEVVNIRVTDYPRSKK